MEKNEFVELVARPYAFSSQDRGWLKAQVARHPHSSVVRMLALLADHAYGYDTDEERRAVALSICNPTLLEERLAGATRRNGEATDGPSVDILNEINTFQEISFKTAPKSVILSNFLQTDPAEENESTRHTDAQPRVNEKKSLQADELLGTETLAVILEQQGKYDRALAIYRNLLARNPEKSSIFAPRIEKLEALLKQ